MRSSLIDGHPNFIKTRDLKNSLAGVIVDIVVVESRYDLAKNYDVMELNTIAGEIVAVDRDFLVRS